MKILNCNEYIRLNSVLAKIKSQLKSKCGQLAKIKCRKNFYFYSTSSLIIIGCLLKEQTAEVTMTWIWLKATFAFEWILLNFAGKTARAIIREITVLLQSLPGHFSSQTANSFTGVTVTPVKHRYQTSSPKSIQVLIATAS